MNYLFSEDVNFIPQDKKKKRNIGRIVVVWLLILGFAVLTIFAFKSIDENLKKMFARTDKPEYSTELTYKDVAEDYKRGEVEFLSQGNRLKGYVYGQKNKDKGLIVISHGLGDGAEDYLMETLYFVDKGYMVFSFDNTGCRESDGESMVSLSQSEIDLDGALKFIEGDDRFDNLPIMLYGHSWGGYAVSTVLKEKHNITASVSIAGYNTPMEMIDQWTKKNIGILAYPLYPYIWLYERVMVGANFNDSAIEGINSVEIPVLIVHGEMDQVVPYDHVSIISHKEEITNKKAEFMVCQAKGQNGHSNLFKSLESVEYNKEIENEYRALEREYDGEIPDDVKVDWYSSLDKDLASELDSTFMRDIYNFFEDARK